MAKCNDCWCEHYDKNMGNCDQCLKSETEKEKSGLNVLLKRRAVMQMDLDKNNKSARQSR